MPDRMTDEMQDEFWKPRQETGQVQKEKQLELLPIAHITGGQLSSRFEICPFINLYKFEFNE